MSANGKVCTGFSFPYVAEYAANGGTVTYSDPMVLARGVSVDISPETGDDNIFYADNVAAESAGVSFTGGTATLTVDGLLEATKKFVMGLPTATTVSSVSIYKYGDDATPPYVGIGFVVRYQSDGVVSYSFVILTKAKFSLASLSAATQGEAIEWQTQELTAQLFRDDSTNHDWKYESATEYSTEAAAVADMVKILGGTT